MDKVKSEKIVIDIVSRPKLDTGIFTTGEYLRNIRKGDTAFIGVVSSNEIIEDHPLFGEENCLVLQFDDVDDIMNIVGVTQRITNAQIEMIGDFIKQNKHFNNWLIQCDAGISRSGAIADVIALYLEKERNDESIYNSFLRNFAYRISPNSLVQKELKKYLNI